MVKAPEPLTPGRLVDASYMNQVSARAAFLADPPWVIMDAPAVSHADGVAVHPSLSISEKDALTANADWSSDLANGYARIPYDGLWSIGVMAYWSMGSHSGWGSAEIREISNVTTLRPFSAANRVRFGTTRSSGGGVFTGLGGSRLLPFKQGTTFRVRFDKNSNGFNRTLNLTQCLAMTWIGDL